MKAQTLDRVLTCYRIGDPDGEYPIFDATGSRIAPGRWNSPDTPLIYTSERFSTALLEKLVNGAGVLPPNQPANVGFIQMSEATSTDSQ